MNLNGIGTLPGMIRPTQPEQRPRVDTGHTGPAVGAPAPAAAPQVRPATPASDLNQTLPVEPPPGTDPELWSVLSTEERAFFARTGAMGPLTYGHLLDSTRRDTPVMRGGRLDVKA